MTTKAYDDFLKAKKILKVKDNCTFQEIKNKYHGELQKYHPDKNQNDNEAHFKTIEIMKAYELFVRYCQNYTFNLSKDFFLNQQHQNQSELASENYNDWWKEKYGKEYLF